MQRTPEQPKSQDSPHRPPDRLARVLKWVGAGTAVLSLIFGLRTLTNLITERRARERQILEALGTAQLQREALDYRNAWATLDRASELDGDDERVRRLQEDVAMDWLRDFRGEGPSPFAAIVDQVSHTLNRGILSATGERRADLQAWLGWWDFLRWRDGQRELDPERRYREALRTDSMNAYANAKLAHWLLWQGGDAEEARRLFSRAVASGRAREYVRRLQLAAYRNASGATGEIGLLALANELRVAREPLPVGLHQRIGAIYFRCGGEAPASCPPPELDRLLSPEDHLATWRWLYADSLSDPARRPMLHYHLARLHERAGQRDSALRHYRATEPWFTRFSPRLAAQVRESLARLSSR
jgi:hypothetical protein